MEKTEDLVRIPRMEFFNGAYFDLHKKNIILDSIRVLEVIDSCFGNAVPFDIKVAGKEAFRIIPSSPRNKFLMKYDYLESATKITIKSAELPKFKQKNGDYTIFINSKGNILN